MEETSEVIKSNLLFFVCLFTDEETKAQGNELTSLMVTQLHK